jgi:hypothetical protein
MPLAFDLSPIRCRYFAAPLAVRSWTGRSALSVVTTTSRAHFATAGVYRTRLSQMRLPASRAH